MEDDIDLAQKILTQIDNEEIRSFFYSQIAKMVLILPADDFVQILKQVSQYNDSVEILKNNWRIILNNSINVLQKRKIFKKIMSFDDEERFEKELILKEIAGEGKYKFKSAGFTSLVMQVGDKIVKLGEWKFQYRVPYHPRIMMPQFRKKYSDNSVLEVYNLGNTKSAKITDQELLKIYKELEATGIIWGDAKKDNVLVLLQDNKLPDFVRSEDFNLFGFLEDERFPTKNHKALKAGELVICDLDCLYTINDPNGEHKNPDQVIIEYIESKKQVEEPGSDDGIRSDR